MPSRRSPAIFARGSGPKGEWTVAFAAESERALVEQMAQLYLYDFSEIDHDDVGEDGRFEFAMLDRFWEKQTHPDYHVVLLRVAGKPAGFALVAERSPLASCPECRYVYEFHVMRAYRRGGYGEAMARALFDAFPGRWQVEEIGPNLAAQRFWRRVIGHYTGGRYREETRAEERFPVMTQVFDTRDRAASGEERGG